LYSDSNQSCIYNRKKDSRLKDQKSNI